MNKRLTCKKCGKRFTFLDFDPRDVPLYLMGANSRLICEKCEHKHGVPKEKYIEKLENLFHNLTSNNCYFEKLNWNSGTQYRNKIWGLLIKWGEIVGDKEFGKIKRWITYCPNRNRGMVKKFITGGSIELMPLGVIKG